MVSRQTPYQAAVEYINMGLAVFPVVYKGKTPLTKNGCKDATTDAAVVKGWWQKWPNANIGIATGAKSNGLLVI
ncbi:MAG: bifunctional DNA primase/polymerase, partial [Clostridia bacterium]